MARSPFLRAFTRAIRNHRNSTALNTFNPERRDFIRRSATVAGFAAFSSLDPWGVSRQAWSKPIGSASDIAIIGGGIAGLTVAYRLAREKIACTVYEGASRLGGRIWTRDRLNSDGMFCELGGELIDTSHEEIVDLAREIGVPVQNLDPPVEDLEDLVFYFGGQHRYQKDLDAAVKDLAPVLARDIEAVFGPNGERVVHYKNHNEAGRRFDHLSLREYLESLSPHVDRWVLDMISMGYMSEYGIESDDQSALNLLTLVDPNPGKDFRVVGDSDETIRIQGGNSRIIEGLQRKIQGKVSLQLEKRLVKIRDLGSQFELTFSNGMSSETTRAAQVICTIPFTMLRYVEGFDQLGLSPVKTKAISELGYGAHSKQMISFSDRIWRKPRGEFKGCTGYGFSDLRSQVFWETSRAQKGKSGILTCYIAGKAGAGALPSVKNHLEDLEKVFPGLAATHDGQFAQYQWSTSPFAMGSYACPKKGQYTTLVGSASEPELNGRILFAGEHASLLSQGFMNGAVETANTAARQVIERVK